MIKFIVLIVLAITCLNGCEKAEEVGSSKSDESKKMAYVPEEVSDEIFKGFRSELEGLKIYSIQVIRGNLIDAEMAETGETIIYGFKSKTSLPEYGWMRNVSALDYDACRYLEASFTDGKWKLKAIGEFDDVKFSWGEFSSRSRSCLGRLFYWIAHDVVYETDKYDNELDRSRPELEEVLSFREKALKALAATEQYRDYGQMKSIDF